MTKPDKTSRLSLRALAVSLVRYWWVAAIAAALVAAAVLYHQVVKHPPVELKVVHDTRIDVSPEEIREIRDLGQWEFLSVSTEELVEWHRRRPLGNDHLARIYSGTLRIGVDLTNVGDDWFTSLPDSTAQLRLPAVGLLDEHFIDEARTRSFYQKGSIPPAALDELYDKARQAMLRRCLTPQNLKAAEQRAREAFTQLFRSLGFKRVEIDFE